MDTVMLISHIVRQVAVPSRNSLYPQSGFALTTPKMSPLLRDTMYSDTNLTFGKHVTFRSQDLFLRAEGTPFNKTSFFTTHNLVLVK
jgi:hypothetical protein